MRHPRRSFAAPFVITMVGAAGSAGFTSCNPPPRRPEPGPAIGTNPPVPDPPPDSANDAPSPNTAEKRWSVYKQGEDCWAMDATFRCKEASRPDLPRPTCNPPPPIKYACPDGVSLDHPIEIAQWTGETGCHVVPEPIDCPKGAICNPPPPIAVACPTR